MRRIGGRCDGLGNRSPSGRVKGERRAYFPANSGFEDDGTLRDRLGDFERFCASIGANTLPTTTETVIAFLHAREPTHSVSALGARRFAILAAHKDARNGLSDDERRAYLLDEERIKSAWKEILRRKDGPQTPRTPVGSAELTQILRQIPADTIPGKLDRAIVLIARACKLDRAEIAALNREDIEFTDEGMVVRVRRGKTDKSGVPVALTVMRADTEECPVAAMEQWIEAGDVRQGHLFHHPTFKESRRIDATYTYNLMKKYAVKAGLDGTRLGARSLRQGAIFDDIGAGKDIRATSDAARLTLAGISRYFGAETRPPNSAMLIAEIEATQADHTITSETERAELIQAQLGQGEYRDKLLVRWGGCAVTGCTINEALRASHIQPWRNSNNQDRLNPANGLLLIANLDALFDEYLISFQDDGQMLVSRCIDGPNARFLGAFGTLLKPLIDEEKWFLSKHRRIFRAFEALRR